MTLAHRLAKLPPRWRWTLHNLIAHPLSEVLYQLGARSASDAVHDRTVPAGGAGAPDARG